MAALIRAAISTATVYRLYDNHTAQLLDGAVYHIEQLRLGVRDAPVPHRPRRPGCLPTPRSAATHPRHRGQRGRRSAADPAQVYAVRFPTSRLAELRQVADELGDLRRR